MSVCLSACLSLSKLLQLFSSTSASRLMQGTKLSAEKGTGTHAFPYVKQKLISLARHPRVAKEFRMFPCSLQECNDVRYIHKYLSSLSGIMCVIFQLSWRTKFNFHPPFAPIASLTSQSALQTLYFQVDNLWSVQGDDRAREKLHMICECLFPDMVLVKLFQTTF